MLIPGFAANEQERNAFLCFLKGDYLYPCFNTNCGREWYEDTVPYVEIICEGSRFQQSFRGGCSRPCLSAMAEDLTLACATLCSILLLKLATLCIGILKYRKLPFLHTCANKAAGIALFAFPFLYVCTDIWIAFSAIAVIAGIAAFEELIITLKCPDFVPDRKGLAMRSAGRRSGRQ